MSKHRFSFKMLLGSILAGLLYGFGGEILYQQMQRRVSNIVVAVVYFTGMYLFFAAAVYLIGRMGYSYANGRVNKKQWAAAFVLMVLLSALFAFLYSRIGTGGKRQEFSSYLFVIDHSGSMNQTDPDGMRYKAMEKLLEHKEPSFCYGVYHFADTVKMARNMLPVREKSEEYQVENGGGTAVNLALETILQDLEAGRLKLSDRCRMILLSDGYATDIDEVSRYRCIRRLEQFADRGISISTVGMANDVDKELLTLIADKTGGAYVSVQEAVQLEAGMWQAAQTDAVNRDLLGYRSEGDAKVLPAVLRVVFLIGLGILIAVEKTVLCERFLNTNSVLASSVAGSAFGGICLEAGMNTFGMNPMAMRVALCVLLGFTLLREDMEAMAPELQQEDAYARWKG